jgi:hypothetical protein
MRFDASDSDNGSVVSNRSNEIKSDYKPIKKDLRVITDQKKLRSYVLENQDVLKDIPTALLNTWVNIPGYKLYRSRGVLGVSKVSDTRYSSMVSVNERLDRLQSVLTKMIVMLQLDPIQLGLTISN